MAVKETFTNCFMCYIKNTPYSYPADNVDGTEATGTDILTGWHIIPNALWRHYVTPRQWAELVIKYEAYRVEGYKITVYNPVPMTTQLSFSGTSAFTAFNNTMYILGYQDTLYETNWENWFHSDNDNFQQNLAWKEGQIYQIRTSTKKRFDLPIYKFKMPNWRTSDDDTWAMQAKTAQNNKSGEGVFPKDHKPDGLFWDPFNRPNHIMELRPGKNAMQYTWEPHPCDNDMWFNLDRLIAWTPYTVDGPWIGGGRPDTRKLTGEMDIDQAACEYQSGIYKYGDFTIPNYANLPIVPMHWWWKEIENSIIDRAVPRHFKPDKYWAGTEQSAYKYGPTQCFLKGLPLFDPNGTLVEITTNICVKMELILSCKPRRSAYFAPTWGPFGWRQLYCSSTRHRNYNEGWIRYRTGGKRRPWQNTQTDSTTPALPFFREDPYVTADQKYPEGTNPRMGKISTPFNLPTKDITVTFHRDSDEVQIRMPKPRKRPEPSPTADIQLMETISQL